VVSFSSRRAFHSWKSFTEVYREPGGWIAVAC
jgi:hypothetical protein